MRLIRMTGVAVAAQLIALSVAATAFAQGNSRSLPVQSVRSGVGAVYVLDNAAAANQVVEFRRAADGRLAPAGTFATGGRGTGDLLDAQGTLILSEGNRWLFAANAGSDDISVFAVLEGGGLTLTSRVASGGDRPISLTVSEDLLYVLNSGGSGNITAFDIGPGGGLTQLAASSRPFSTTASAPCPRPGDIALDPDAQCNVAGPAQVQFSSGGHVLAVTERATSLILTYVVGDDGRATPAGVYQGPANSTPFGFDFAKRGRLIVSNAFLDLPNLGAASSFIVSATGDITEVTGAAAAPNGQTASCWLIVSNSGRVAFIANPIAATLTSYTINNDGSLSLLNGQAGLIGEAGDPRDMALNENGRFLYALNNRAATLSSFVVRGDGSLVRLELRAADGFPANAVGLAAR
ncbi:MAG: beta-propeller fold lactonase family protein [Acidobacteria bacterium]|nr:beta-propeller fold lactonase family protein [Acidobacteriota bacterium]